MYSYADAYGAFADASRDQQSPSVTGSINRKPIQQASSSSSPSSYAADDGPVPSESSTLVGGNSSRSSRSGGYAMNGLPRRTCAHALKYSLIYFIWNVLVLTLATAGVIWLIWIRGDPAIWRNPYFIALECVVVIAIVFDVLLEMCVQQCRKFWCICVPRNGDTPMFCCGRQGYVFVVSCYTAFMLSMLWRSLTLSLSLSLSLSLTHTLSFLLSCSLFFSPPCIHLASLQVAPARRSELRGSHAGRRLRRARHLLPEAGMDPKRGRGEARERYDGGGRACARAARRAVFRLRRDHLQKLGLYYSTAGRLLAVPAEQLYVCGWCARVLQLRWRWRGVGRGWPSERWRCWRAELSTCRHGQWRRRRTCVPRRITLA